MSAATIPFILSEESEAEIRDDEVVCPVTNLTYYKGLAESPHYYVRERDGKVLLT